MNIHVLQVIRNRSALGIVSALVLCTGIGIYGGQTVFAQTDNSVTKGLTISPVRTELTIAPGTVQTGQLMISNTTSNDMDVVMNAEVFNVIDENYTYSFNPTSPVAGWVRFDPTTTTLASGKSKTIDYSINVPVTGEPGGKYLSLFATTSVKSTKETAGYSERVGSLLYITVSGDVSRTGYVISVFTPRLMVGDSTWSATLRDSGTAHYTSNYSMTVQTLWNSTLSSESNSSLVLPKTIRLVQGTLAAPKVPGIYKLIFSASLGDSPDVKIVSYVLYMPIYGWVLITLIAAFIVGRVRRVVEKRREKHGTTT